MNTIKRSLVKIDDNTFEIRTALGGSELRYRADRVEVVLDLERRGYSAREIANALVAIQVNKHHWAEFDDNNRFTVSGCFQN